MTSARVGSIEYWFPHTAMSSLRRTAESELPTHFGRFRLLHYRRGEDEALALVRGELGTANVLCRVHSECMTGEVFGSLRCDCRPQLELALEKLSRADGGVIVYLRQEGRGIGLGNKIRAYSLQDQGRDTVQANLELGFAADERSYDLAAAVLEDLGVGSVCLMTNNPAKIAGLESAGIVVVEHLPHWTGRSAHSSDYVETKRLRMGHLGEPDDESEKASG